jgi:hypothetical protein
VNEVRPKFAHVIRGIKIVDITEEYTVEVHMPRVTCADETWYIPTQLLCEMMKSKFNTWFEIVKNSLSVSWFEIK